jgi:hypothetical protein
MLMRSLAYSDMAIMRPFSLGDVQDTQETFTALTTAGAGTVLAAAITGGILRRTGPVAGFADTFDSAANIISSLSGNSASVSTQGPNNFNPSFQSVTYGTLYQQPGQPQPGSSFRWLYINQVAFAMTAAAPANAGVTISNASVAASLARMYLVQIVNGTPPSLVNGNLTNASPIVTGLTLAQTNLISPGQAVYGTSVGAAAQVLSVQPGVGFTTTVNASATVLSAITLTPNVLITGLFSATA